MTREEAIGVLEDVRDAICDNIPGNHAELDELREAVRMATEALRERKTGDWIPCGEQLPEIGQSVLLSVGGMYSAEGCLREDGDWAQFRWDAIQRKDMVGAWKPLPEPYKGEQE